MLLSTTKMAPTLSRWRLETELLGLRSRLDADAAQRSGDVDPL